MTHKQIAQKLIELAHELDPVPRATKKDFPIIFPVWKTITIGTSTKAKRLKEFSKKDIYISDWAKQITEKIKFSTKKDKLDLVKITGKELGFEGNATREQIYAKAKERGLELVPAELGLYLRAEYNDQPNGEWFLIGMDPISGSDGYPFIFGVRRGGDGGRWLRACYVSPGNLFSPEHRWVFRLRK